MIMKRMIGMMITSMMTMMKNKATPLHHHHHRYCPYGSRHGTPGEETRCVGMRAARVR